MGTEATKYSDQFVDWLVLEGYTHCFFVAGGNIMHLLDSVRSRMTCVPFVNEIGAAIAAEYFTVANEGISKAFALVTAGPGLTNTVTAIASAWVESRELLVVGGQVKSSDLSHGEVRQRGIQEIGGLDIVQSICKETLAVIRPVPRESVMGVIRSGAQPRKGPIFIEMCLDAQAALPLPTAIEPSNNSNDFPKLSDAQRDDAASMFLAAERPVFLLGQGMNRKVLGNVEPQLRQLGIPILTTWNGADLIPSDHELYWGRPDTWGQRSANMLLQQADLVIALGTRLGVQQTGFAWQEFVPVGKIIHVDIDNNELKKGHPRTDLAVQGDAGEFLTALVQVIEKKPEWESWKVFGDELRAEIPIDDAENVTKEGFVNPYQFLSEIAGAVPDDSLLIPCSSGAAYSCSMQSLQQVGTQRIITNKGMASMGYGLSGAIGASLSAPNKTTLLFEGDGGFAQNLQELGTVAANNLNLKIFVFSNDGYASIRTTQRNYFNGAWIGCDSETGLGFPNWELLAKSFNIPFKRMDAKAPLNSISDTLGTQGPAFIEVPIDPEQTYFPKIASAVQPDGSMKSNPLHKMSPEISEKQTAKYLKFISHTS